MAKLKYTILFLLLTGNMMIAQVPENFNYQAIIRDNAGELIVDKNIDVKVSIIDNTITGTVLYVENHTVSTNAYGLVNLLIGSGIVESGSFSSIIWGMNDKFLNIDVDAGSGYVDLGTVQLLSVPYTLYAAVSDSSTIAASAHSANTANVADLLGSGGVYSTSSDTLFVVKDHDGNVVFAVFPDGAQVIVNEAAKGKAKAGGFAVSGRNPSKEGDFEILKVTPDSTRIYINESDTKAKAGGFAISGRSPSKAEAEYFNISGNSTAEIINPSEARVLWFPRKEAFLAGRVLVESPDSVGFNSTATGFESKAVGSYSQAMGYQSIARGNNATAIGNYAIANGNNSFALGDNATANARYSFAFGFSFVGFSLDNDLRRY